MSKAMIKFCGYLQTGEAEVNPSGGTVMLEGKPYPVHHLNWDAPVSGTIYGTLLNYKGALAAIGDAANQPPYKELPKAPILYIKPANTIIGYGMPIPLPEGIAEIEVGASVGVVIGQTATRVSAQNALDYVAGYTIVNDVSVPHTSVYRPAVSQKCRDGFCPVGPWVVERAAITNPNALGLRVYINGELKQENHTSNLIRSVARLMADVTEFMTLYPGDILLVGVPEGAPLAKTGDHIKIEIDEIGSLENTVVMEAEWIRGVTK